MMAPADPSNQQTQEANYFRELYDQKDEYQARRDPGSHNARQILLEVLKFKIPSLVSVMPKSFTYRSVLEVGCATGELVANFPASEYGLTRVGIDVSPRNVETAAARFPHVIFRSQDIHECSDVFDLVILSDVLEHVPADVELLRAAAERGSVVLVNLPLEKNWLNRNRAYGVDDPSGHLRAYSLENGLDLVERAGLRAIHWERAWSHESAYDVERRALRKRMLGRSHSGGILTGSLKALVHEFARVVPLFGRRLYPSNLFVSARAHG